MFVIALYSPPCHQYHHLPSCHLFRFPSLSLFFPYTFIKVSWCCIINRLRLFNVQRLWRQSDIYLSPSSIIYYLNAHQRLTLPLCASIFSCIKWGKISCLLQGLLWRLCKVMYIKYILGIQQIWAKRLSLRVSLLQKSPGWEPKVCSITIVTWARPHASLGHQFFCFGRRAWVLPALYLPGSAGGEMELASHSRMALRSQTCYTDEKFYDDGFGPAWGRHQQISWSGGEGDIGCRQRGERPIWRQLLCRDNHTGVWWQK